MESEKTGDARVLAAIRDRNKIVHTGNLPAQRLTDPKF